MREDLWSLILAGGQGRRLSSVTRGTPKQFWKVNGGHSLLDETRARLSSLVPPERTTVVVAQGHQGYIHAANLPWTKEWLMYQPHDRGTATGALLALLPVLAYAPDAIVLMTPSDHCGTSDLPDRRTGRRGRGDVAKDRCRALWCRTHDRSDRLWVDYAWRRVSVAGRSPREARSRFH